MSASLQIRPLEMTDIPAVAGFPPPDWHFNFAELLHQHLGRPYFFPLVGESEGVIVAVGQGIRNGDTGWLGNIIVPEPHRRLGHGFSITAALVETLRAEGCRRQLLIATAMGEPVYAKLGFRVTGHYAFFNRWRGESQNPEPGVVPLEPEDREALLLLDRQTVSEDRSDLISPFLDGGFGYRESREGPLRGYFLPRFGAGLVVAVDRRAGEALLQFKHARMETGAVVPEGNLEALAFLLGQGGVQSARAPRMALGDDLEWRPSHVWSRAAGYCG